MSASDSNDWLAGINLNAVKPTGPRKTTKSKKPKKPKKRIVYGTGASLAPRIPSWATGSGPDQQRQVSEVVGEFIPTTEVCTTRSSYEELVSILAIIEAADHPNKARLLAVLKASAAAYEFEQASREHRAEQAAENLALLTLVSRAVNQIPREDD